MTEQEKIGRDIARLKQIRPDLSAHERADVVMDSRRFLVKGQDLAQSEGRKVHSTNGKP